MADLRPFRGFVYDTSRAPADQVLAPPYDVLDQKERDELAARHEYSAVHAILPEGEGDLKYQHARRLLDAWKSEGVLKQSPRPSIYRYHQVFEHPLEPERQMTRRGYIAAVRLHEFSEKIILPHERTLKGPKIDRLKLMDATRMHTSQIFTLYSDPSGVSDQLFEEAERGAPVIDGTTDDGTRHRMWACDDAELVGELRRIMGPLNLYIADGHHRYETMLAMRNQLEEETGGPLPMNSAGNFGTMFVANMDDPGMVVLPTHRMIHSVEEFSRERLLEGAKEHFDLSPVDPSPAAIRRALEGVKEPGFVALLPNGGAQLMVLSRPPADLKGVLAQLDVTVLHTLVLEKVLGIDRAAQEAKTNINYLKSDEAAFERLPQAQVTFMMRATPVAQVKACSDAGEFMPQKSTFFVPKIASGMVYRSIDANEEL